MSALKQQSFSHYFNERVDLESYLDNYLKTLRKSYIFFVCTVNGDGTEFTQRSFHKTQRGEALKYIKANLHKRVFIPTALFDKRSREVEHIAQIRKIIIDLDPYRLEKFKGMSLDQVVEELQNKEFATGKIPTSNGLTYSGRGLYLEYNLEYTPGGKVLAKRNVIAKILFELLREYGADAKSLDSAHVFGLADTTNWKYKTDNVVKTFKNDVSDYSLAELSRILPNLWDLLKKNKKIQTEHDPKPKKSGNRSVKITPIHKERTLSFDQIQSIKKLIEIRDGDMFECREMAMFFVRNAYHKMHSKRFYSDDKNVKEKLYEESLELAIEINKTLNDPLKLAEVKRSTLSTKKLYNFKTETINDWFNITMDEQIQLKLKTKEAKREKSRRQMEDLRRSRGVVLRKEYEEDRKEGKEHLLSMLRRQLEHNPDATRKELAELLGVHYTYITKLKKEL